MATAVRLATSNPGVYTPGSPGPFVATLFGGAWRAPLVPLALALTAGVVLDRQESVPLAGSLFAAAAALAAWAATFRGRPGGLALVYLALATAAFGAAYHHLRRDVVPPDDIGFLASDSPRVVQLRGVLTEGPAVRFHPRDDPLEPPRPGEPPETTVAVLRVSQCRPRDDWLPVSGSVQLIVSGALPGLYTGDRVEAVGRLYAPQGPANPGERDYAEYLRGRGIRAVVFVQRVPGGGVTRLEAASLWSPAALLARVRGWGVRVLRRELPARQGDLAAALLLGEGSALDRDEWDKYKRTGVVHVLVVSGQHFIILANVLGVCLVLLHVRQRRGAWLVIGLVVFYALLTGLRPSIVRAAVTVTALAAGFLLRRVSHPAAALALAWIVVVLLNPAWVEEVGCLFSFLAVAGLYWNTVRRREAETGADPLQQLVEEGRPAWQRYLRALGRGVVYHYALGLGVWLILTPLLAARLHIVPLAALLIGPPVVLLTSMALLSGFLLLLTVPLGPLAWPFAFLTEICLAACEWLVSLADGWGMDWYVPDIPPWWLYGFYLMLGAALLIRQSRRHWRWVALAGAGWICVGLLASLVRPRPDEMRVTFLAVGHGGCTVIELPDGRTLLYDAGSLCGPDVARHQIAPFLWHRGIRRIDEVFLSHADLDHFNGLRDLLSRFSVGQVTVTPSFANKRPGRAGGVNPPSAYTLEILQQKRVPIRVARRGDRLSAGDVTLDVLHPPEVGPEGAENVRSMVLLVRHGPHRILLTGDLEREGLAQFFGLPPPEADVMMAPHHGSKGVDCKGLMARVRPKVVVSCQGPPRFGGERKNPYAARGARYLPTWPHGAVTVRSHGSGLVVETFVTKERFVVR